MKIMINPMEFIQLARIGGFAFYVALSGTDLLRGQNPAPADTSITTDRPAVADSSIVVPQGSVQAENGLQITTSGGQRSIDAPETELRFGVTNNTELRLFVPDYYWDLGGGAATGFGDLSVGLKRQIGPIAGGFDLSIILFTSLPTGAHRLSSHGYDPGMQAPWSHKLSTNWAAAGQFALYWPTQGAARNLTGESTILLDRQITNPWDAFVEYAGDFPERGGPRHLLHFGSAYKIAPRHQVDFHVGVGLSSAAVDHFVGIGYSFRFQAFR